MVKMTTVKLKPATKDKLDKVKKDRETYGDTIDRIVSKKIVEAELVEGYLSRYDEDGKIAKDWEGTLGDGLDEW